jgi:ABC-type branched-subunit amino acid transport system substrate-binding protein
VYLPAYPALAVVAIKQMKDLGVKVPIVGGDALEAGEFLDSGVAEGVLFFTGAVGSPDDFKAKVKAMSGVEVNIIGPLAYDAVKIFAKVMAEKGINAADIVAGLNSLTYTSGVSFKSISFDDNGDLEGATYDVKVVKNSKVEIVK